MATNNIFKFVSLRPPQLPSDEKLNKGFVKFDDGNKSSLHKEIEALTGDDKREKAEGLAKNYIAANPIEAEMAKEIALVKAILSATKVSDAKKLAKATLKEDIDTYLKKKENVEKWEKLWNNLYAQSLIPDFYPQDRNSVFDGIKAIKYLTLISKMKDDETPPSEQIFQNIRPIIPSNIIPKNETTNPNAPTSEANSKKVVEEFKSLHAELKKIENSIKDIKNTNIKYRALEQRKVAIEVDSLSQVGKGVIQDFKMLDLKTPIIQNSNLGIISLIQPKKEKNISISLSQKSIVVPSKKPWVLSEFGAANLNQGTKELIKKFDKEFDELEAGQIVSSLEGKMSNKVKNFIRDTAKEYLGQITVLPEFQEVVSMVSMPGKIKPTKKPTISPGSATARGVKPLGIGDLLVVKQELQKYTAGEVAHIENVLKSESKKRTHVRIRENEEILITETEQIEESERDLQTTERFELHKEAQTTIDSEMSVKAGLSVTASYGFVTATAYGDFAYNQSKSESTKNASNFAKDVIDRSVSRILQRAREERVRRTLERFEEINEHGFDNTKGPDHAIGIYRWVDKHYKARVINYGKRLMIEFVVPEPAAFYIHTQANRELKGITVTKPELPKNWGRKLEPGDLTKSNYSDYVAEYNVQDVEPYPDDLIRVSAALAGAPGAGGDKHVDFAETSDKLKIPKGYQAIDIYGEKRTTGIKDSSFFSNVLIGGEAWGSITAYGVEGIIPISVNGWAKSYNVNVVAKCELKPDAKEAWQLKTYQAIMNAYESALADYYEQVAAAQIQAGVDIQGRNPAFNRKIEQEELRKGALRILTNNFAKTKVSGNWRYSEDFNSMMNGGAFGYPEFNISEAQTEGKMIQFFEQAFEWNNITYRFYPYFWGRKADWDETYTKEDTDPNFTDFLRAGGARAIVPVHPAYTEAMLHYLHTNEIWNGGEPPTLDDPLFISIVDEIKADTNADLGASLPVCSIDSGYPCLADEWEVKVPTSLVYLQKDSDLPDFTVPKP